MKMTPKPKNLNFTEAHRDIDPSAIALKRIKPFRCPDETDLAEYFAQELDDFGMSAIKFHLLTCKECEPRRDAILRAEFQPKRQDFRAPPVACVSQNCDENGVGSHVGAKILRPSMTCTSMPSTIPHWDSVTLKVLAEDAPGMLAAYTQPYAQGDIFLNRISFAVCDDDAHFRLNLEGEGRATQIAAVKLGPRVRKRTGFAPTKTIANPQVFAFAAQFDDEPGLASQVAGIVSTVRDPNDCTAFDPSVVPSGAVVSMVGHTADVGAAETNTQQFFFLQGLIAAPARSVQEEIVHDLLAFFREQRALRWFLGNFGTPHMPTRFLSVDPDRALETTRAERYSHS